MPGDRGTPPTAFKVGQRVKAGFRPGWIATGPVWQYGDWFYGVAVRTDMGELGRYHVKYPVGMITDLPESGNLE